MNIIINTLLGFLGLSSLALADTLIRTLVVTMTGIDKRLDYRNFPIFCTILKITPKLRLWLVSVSKDTLLDGKNTKESSLVCLHNLKPKA